VLGQEGTAVVVTDRDSPRGIGADRAEDLADGERQRRGGGVAVAVLGNVPAETFGVPVLGDDGDVAVLDRRDDGAVGAPQTFGASVVIVPSWFTALFHHISPDLLRIAFFASNVMPLPEWTG
jgi:hypothetical protein